MATKVGINGFGRIGRQVLKIMKEKYPEEFDVVAFNDLGDLKTMAHLFKYDSNYGKFDGEVEVREDGLVIEGDFIESLSEPDPAKLPWGEKGVQIVIEGTGVFRAREDASKHIAAGAKKVIITAPAKNPDITVVMGVNEGEYDPQKHNIISNASCTTNCLAPVAKVLMEQFGIKKGLMTTIHSYTNDQQLLDFPHKDLRRARAAAMSMIPTTTGAAAAVSLVLPALKGKLDGMAIRVATPNVSVVDLVADLEKSTTVEAVNSALKKEAQGSLKGIMDFCEEPLVSIDFNNSHFSSIVDGLTTSLIDGTMVKVLSWYDNETGYSARIIDLIDYIGKQQ